MKKSVLVILAILLIIIVFILVKCNDNTPKSLVGSWASDVWVYTFNEDGTGDYADTSITYSASGDELIINYSGSSSPATLKYRIEGNKLIISDMFGSEVVYVKQ